MDLVHLVCPGNREERSERRRERNDNRTRKTDVSDISKYSQSSVSQTAPLVCLPGSVLYLPLCVSHQLKRLLAVDDDSPILLLGP